ncbi:GTPase [Nocardioides mesophilus]|uniref:50S ribosome-binding GTPase n=1 Tax=Nocardioides mesophilus TaxID=433659 RepID=A0A7G9RCU9_9ACTN|nr:GTPase [Nocardioides mesophilus]QNN53424.1 50S ribosome-binding GTPase [Nocardioides mesophilus]
MTSLVEGAKRLVGRGDDVPARIEGLRLAAEAARGRLDDALVDEAARIAVRAGERLSLSGNHTVVALAGATGSGKSSTFNALTGLDLAAIGVRRPTTSWTMACAWGAEGAGELMDWVGVPKRHQVSRNSMLDGPREERDLEGLVLLDLPDHDSTEVSHHVEVDRLVKLADMLVWVLDPQKYADAAIHDRYLRPLASHREIMLVALNHIDEVPTHQRASMVADLERLLEADGLGGVPVIATSARHGDGIPELRRAISQRVAAKKATRARLMADVSAAATRMLEVNGDAKPGDVARDRKDELVSAFADAAGVPTVVHAVEQSTRRRAAAATGWPVTAWLGRLKPDPLKRLHLDLGARGKELTGRARTSVPEASPVQRARVDIAVRSAADAASAALTPPWAAAVRRASVSRLDDLGDALDGAVSSVDLGVSRTPVWWRLVQVLQWAIVLLALGGAAWLGVLAVMGYLQLPEPTTPSYGGFPVPTSMLVGGVALGILLGLVCRVLVGWSARRRARSVDRRLRSAIGGVTEHLVLTPIEGEITAYRTVRDGLAAALR